MRSGFRLPLKIKELIGFNDQSANTNCYPATHQPAGFVLRKSQTTPALNCYFYSLIYPEHGRTHNKQGDRKRIDHP
jgi:hypothetical protein